MHESASPPKHTSAPTGTRLHPPFEPRFHTVQSSDLLQGGKSVVIDHNGQIYRLQATKLGKLILTK